MKNKKLLSEYFAWGKDEVEKENRKLKRQYKKDKKQYDFAYLMRDKDLEVSGLYFNINESFFWQYKHRKELKEKLKKKKEELSTLIGDDIFTYFLMNSILEDKPYLTIKEFQPTKEGFYKWLSDNDKLK